MMYELFLDKNKDWVSFPNKETNSMEVRVRRREEIERWANEFGFKVGSTYGDGGQMIGDPEKDSVADYERPQDDLISLYGTDTDTDEDKEFKEFIGWESDPLRPTHEL